MQFFLLNTNLYLMTLNHLQLLICRFSLYDLALLFILFHLVGSNLMPFAGLHDLHTAISFLSQVNSEVAPCPSQYFVV